MRKAQEHRAAGGRSHAMFRRLPQNVAAVSIGKNEPGVVWHDVDRHPLGNGEIEPVAMGTIFAPFCIIAKIGNGGFDLDD